MWSSGEDLAFSPPWPGFDSRHGNLLNLIGTLSARVHTNPACRDVSPSGRITVRSYGVFRPASETKFYY